LIAHVFVNIKAKNIDRSFSYLVPPEFSTLKVGCRVLVPFGRRQVDGLVVAIEDEGNPDKQQTTEGLALKQVLKVFEDRPQVFPDAIETAEWLSRYYVCSMGEALNLFANIDTKIITTPVYHWQDALNETSCSILIGDEDPNVTSQMNQIKKMLIQQGAVKETVLVRKFGAQVLQELERLQRTGAVKKQLDVRIKGSRRAAAGKKKAGNSGLSSDGVYAGDGVAEVSGLALPSLNREQAYACRIIHKAMTKGEGGSFLLHGVTGSGKTRVYLESAKLARSLGRQALILVPEIALTGQLVSRFNAAFGNDVAVFHSGLSERERSAAWHRIQDGNANILIGARSALYAPFMNLGLIVVDEEHEFSYKQEEAPYYHAREVALDRGRRTGAAVILGSATPSIETYYRALQGTHILLELPERIEGLPLPATMIVDMRKYSRRLRSIFSPELAELLKSTVNAGQKAILLLNRRGYAPVLLCRECGQAIKCPNCSVSLVYHASSGRYMRCHYCDHVERPPDVCPDCGSQQLKFFGIGTQRVEEQVKELLPGVRVARLDRDVAARKNGAQNVLTSFATGDVDVLVGTQMVAKGLDIPEVTAVGIVSADTSLYLPDFRSSERTFALLAQAAGRAGRALHPGKVIIQTYNPEHYAIVCGAAQDYKKFYTTEIGFRHDLNYPPFVDLIKLSFRATTETKVKEMAKAATDMLRKRLASTATEIFGPFPSPISRIENVFRYQSIIKTTEPTNVKQAIREMKLYSLSGVTVDADPVGCT